MSKSVKILGLVALIVVSLSATVLLYFYTPECDYCGSKFCFGTCKISTPNDTINNNSDYYSNSTNQNTTRLFETQPDDDYLNSITFIGDSRTVAFSLYGIDESKIFAETGLNHETARTKEVVYLTEDKIVTIKDAVAATAPDIMVINFGINGAGWMSEESFIQTYKEFVEDLVEVSPNSIVILESILPVSYYYEGVTNEKLDILNDLIYEYAKERGFYYLATNEALKDSYNSLNSEYSSDGLHYNEAGNLAILDYIKRHAVYRLN